MICYIEMQSKNNDRLIDLISDKGLHPAPTRPIYRVTLGCSQVVRQCFLVACTVGSNPTTPANFLLTRCFN